MFRHRGAIIRVVINNKALYVQHMFHALVDLSSLIKIRSHQMLKLWNFYVLLTVHLGIILINNQLYAQFFFIYVYFNSVCVSSTHVVIIRRINCINKTFGIGHSM
jgi:hypothetical protein